MKNSYSAVIKSPLKNGLKTFLQRRYLLEWPVGIYEKMLNTFSYQGNAN